MHGFTILLKQYYKCDMLGKAWCNWLNVERPLQYSLHSAESCSYLCDIHFSEFVLILHVNKLQSYVVSLPFEYYFVQFRMLIHLLFADHCHCKDIKADLCHCKDIKASIELCYCEEHSFALKYCWLWNVFVCM